MSKGTSHGRRVGFISDMHVGSLFALWPDEYVIEGTGGKEDGTKIVAGKSQRIIRQYYEDFIAREIKDADIILLLGDLAQGNNRKEYGRDITTAELSAQKRVCTEFLKPVCAGRPTYGVSGSKYHQALETSLDRDITESVGGKFVGLLKHLKVFEDYIIQIAHGGSSGGVLYEGTLLDRDLGLMMRAEGQKKIPYHVSLIVRGHRHTYRYFEWEEIAYLALPCWQAWTPWFPLVEKYGKWQPTFGGVVVDFWPGGTITKHKRFYPPVQIHDNLIEI